MIGRWGTTSTTELKPASVHFFLDCFVRFAFYNHVFLR